MNSYIGGEGMIHNEDSRVKIPLTLHMIRLGYKYLSKKDQKIDSETNIFKMIFKESIQAVNSVQLSDEDIEMLILEIKGKISDNDKGKNFYERLMSQKGIKLIDTENINNNNFHVVTELQFRNGDDYFQPDITILINGIPLSYIEVKKPNTPNALKIEFDRTDSRLNNTAFKSFFNLLQLLVVSNNMDYNDETVAITQGSFYTTPNGESTRFSFFREERREDIVYEVDLDETTILEVLVDNNITSIINQEEFKTNLQPSTPVNLFVDSLFSKERLILLLKYGIAYVKQPGKNVEKHVIRYPQLFAMLALKEQLDNGLKKGVIWHTQGSGKTSLAFFMNQYLRKIYQDKNIITKFYFVVDRIDLLEQSKNEFEYRGLEVTTVDSKQEFIENMKSSNIVNTGTGSNGEITVINIQKFSEDSVVEKNDYNLNIQRIYFLDEVHRSYNPKGSFLANLFNSDKNAIFIGLTGTPILKDDYKTTSIFGGYIHRYFYNSSIADRYTLRIKREQIEVKEKEKFKEIITQLKKDNIAITKNDILESHTFCEAITKYIGDNFKTFRRFQHDNSLGGMIVASSSEQARKIQTYFENLYPELKVALVLYDEGDKEYKKSIQKGFKIGEYDLLIVYNMLLTGFDAPRLKKLYLARLVRQHNLLQTLTRVNRPYKNYSYGYIVDFVDISDEYDKTNQKYLEELQEDFEGDLNTIKGVFVDIEKIKERFSQIKDKLFMYDFSNLEQYKNQINALTDITQLIELRDTLKEFKEVYNELRLSNELDLIKEVEYERIIKAFGETDSRIQLIRMTQALTNQELNQDLINMKLEDVIFEFIKIKEEEMVVADNLKASVEKLRKELVKNIDKRDEMFIQLNDELKSIIQQSNLLSTSQLTTQQIVKMNNDIKLLIDKAKGLNGRNEVLLIRYKNDSDCVRLHKRISKIYHEKKDSEIFEKVLKAKTQINEYIIKNNAILDNESYFKQAIRSQVKIVFNDFLNIKQIADLFINELLYEQEGVI